MLKGNCLNQIAMQMSDIPYQLSVHVLKTSCFKSTAVTEVHTSEEM